MADAAAIINAIGAVVSGVATAVLAGVAVDAAKASREQLKGTHDYQLARRILTGVYRMRELISRVRDPILLESEWMDRPGRDPHDPNVDSQDFGYTFNKRWQPLYDVSTILDVDLLEAEAAWADNLGPASSALQECTHDLWTAISELVKLRRPGYRQHHEKRYQQMEATLYRGASDDAYDAHVKAAVRKFELVLKPKLH